MYYTDCNGIKYKKKYQQVKVLDANTKDVNNFLKEKGLDIISVKNISETNTEINIYFMTLIVYWEYEDEIKPFKNE